MTITKIHQETKKRYRVFIDGEDRFFLYGNEIARYHLREDMPLSPELLSELLHDCVYRHAKQKAMALLKHADRTREELRRRLTQNGFGADAVETAIEYVDSYGYINDLNYAQRYVYFAKEKKSYRQIRGELMKKGVSQDIIDQVLEQEDGSQEELLTKLIEKKQRGMDSENPKDFQKLYAYLIRRGFGYEEICRCLKKEQE
ncbi:regulatory protein RecX [Anaerolentibacter hominis]|uniref:regulatory protein RecX n=1 Tax=Anaerolentibacter hominis TaxID=3079009 RepID=UPI0031B85051